MTKKRKAKGSADEKKSWERKPIQSSDYDLDFDEDWLSWILSRGCNRLLTEKQQQQFFEITDPEDFNTAVSTPTVPRNDVVNNGRPVRQRALPHRLQDYERFQDNKVNNDGDFVHFALMAESEQP
ncbi:hypothetical protein KIW84_035489 [Lathyrus oleraceus]|uniref:Uncharacterized protein n=1 Tax=Pisum sativum TaxID=3888 RepID=A0A9D4Y1U0_PEA|nr:hypothetical protein KIW84_035489 [Pisum sativum]